MWLNTLNASARNSKPMLSVMAKCLNSAISKFVRRGFVRKFLGMSPKVSPLGAAKADGLYSSGPKPEKAKLGTFDLGSPTTSGYDCDEPTLTPLATPALSPKTPLPGLNGVPLCTVTIPDHCHPPRILCDKPGFLKKGRSYTYPKLNRWRWSKLELPRALPKSSLLRIIASLAEEESSIEWLYV